MFRQPLTAAEFELIKVLWRLESGSVREVRDALHEASGKDLAYTTVMTTLGRMVDKAAVRVNQERQPFTYRAACRRTTMLRERLEEFVQVTYEGDLELLQEQLESLQGSTKA